VAEKSDYKATSKHAEVVEYCERLAKLSPPIRVTELGVTSECRKLPLVILADPPIAERQIGCVAMGNIHAGEVDGKEALMRDLAPRRHIIPARSSPVRDRYLECPPSFKNCTRRMS
jgi:dipeptidyl-peptidase 4